jgi:hypothetical protein
MASSTSRGSIASLGSIRDAADITPHATNTFAETRGITCSGAGTIAARFSGADADVSLTLNAGQMYPYGLVAIRVTGTTATGIVGLY